MQTAYGLFDWQVKVTQPKNPPVMTDKEQIVPITFELYPVEVLDAARKALGVKKLNDYAVELYKFAINAKSKGISVKVSQLSGVLLSQEKLDTWFASISPKTLLETGVQEEVFLAYAKFHQARIEESEAVMDKLRKLAGVE